MKKHLLNLFLLTSVLTVMATSATFADVSKVSIAQKQQQTELYNQQLDYLRQQTEYLRQQTEALKQQNEALKQNQMYNQGYLEGQRYYHRDVYVPGVFLGGITAGYLLGRWPGYRHCCHHYHHWY